MKNAYTVKDVFKIKGRGLVLTSAPHASVNAMLFIGSAIELRRPDGSIVATRVRGIEMSTPNMQRIFAILIADDLQTSDVPAGTEVWTDEVKP